MPRPRKGTPFHSYADLVEFVGQGVGAPQRHLGLRRVLRTHGDCIYLRCGTAAVAGFSKEKVELYAIKTYSHQPHASETAQAVANAFGYRFGPASYGPNRGVMCLFPLKTAAFGIESDLDGIPLVRDSPFWHLTWTGRVLYTKALDAEAKGKAMVSYRRRADVQLDRNRTARTLGFQTGAKMGGYPMPDDRSQANLIRMNLAARSMGYVHVAHAWARDRVMVGGTEREQSMLINGIGKLLASVHDGQFGYPEGFEMCHDWHEVYEKDYPPMDVVDEYYWGR